MVMPKPLADPNTRAIELIQGYVPEFKVLNKADSKLQRFIGKAMFFNKGYMTNFYTTIGYTTYRPIGAAGEPWEWEILLHEGKHAIQAKKLTRPLMGALYLLPFLPLPAPGRAWFEFEAYCVSMAVAYLKNPADVNDWYIENQLVPYFTGSEYAWMFPFKGTVKKAFQKFHEKLKSGEAFEDPYLNDIKNLVG